jgi:glutamine cyclotransferase
MKDVVPYIPASIAILIALLDWQWGVVGLLVRETTVTKVLWQKLRSVPQAEYAYTPQGMTFDGEHVVFANSWKNMRSMVYSFSIPDMIMHRQFKMPTDAVHTSGLAYDGEFLWACDYISNRCYKIRPVESFESGEAVVVGSFDTGLRGTSACCLLFWKGRRCLAISDYMRTKRTYVIDHESALHAGKMEAVVLFSYRNGGFSQGLAFDGQHLYESENKLGIDVINKLDIARLIDTGHANESIVEQIEAPWRGVEDMAFDGQHLYISDEVAFKFYRTRMNADRALMG